MMVNIQAHKLDHRLKDYKGAMREPNMKETKFKCSVCMDEFDKGWSEEEAIKEMADNFDDVSKEECALVCDDCYLRFMEWYNRNNNK